MRRGLLRRVPSQRAPPRRVPSESCLRGQFLPQDGSGPGGTALAPNKKEKGLLVEPFLCPRRKTSSAFSRPSESELPFENELPFERELPSERHLVSAFEIITQRATAARTLELLQSLGLNLTNALTRHVELFADFLERVLALLADSETLLQNALLTNRE